MSDTQSQLQPMPDPVWTPQCIIALYGMTIVAGTVVAVFMFGTAETRSQTVGGILALGGAIANFFFGSSKGSQQKDALIASKQGAATGTVTTTTTPATTTVTTEPASETAPPPKGVSP